MPLDWKSAYAAMHAQGEVEFPPACLYYVLQQCRQASSQRGGNALSPEDLTNHFRQQIRRDFGSGAVRVLEDWGLQTPEDLGKAVVLLGRHHCLSLEPTDTVETFAASGPVL